jgi:hypothetical protein
MSSSEIKRFSSYFTGNNYFSVIEPNRLMICKTCGFRGGEYEDAVFWDVTPCSYCKNGRFGGTYHLHNQSDKKR